MNLSTSLKNFKKIHKKKYNQSIYYSESCKDYNFIENLYKFILVQKNSFILIFQDPIYSRNNIKQNS